MSMSSTEKVLKVITEQFLTVREVCDLMNGHRKTIYHTLERLAQSSSLEKTIIPSSRGRVAAYRKKPQSILQIAW